MCVCCKVHHDEEHGCVLGKTRIQTRIHTRTAGMQKLPGAHRTSITITIGRGRGWVEKLIMHYECLKYTSKLKYEKQ